MESQQESSGGKEEKEEEEQQKKEQRPQNTVATTDNRNKSNNDGNDEESSTSISLIASMQKEAEATKRPLHHHRSSLPFYTSVPRTTLSSSSSSEYHQQKYKLQARNTSTNIGNTINTSNKKLKTTGSGDGSSIHNYAIDAPTTITTTTQTLESQPSVTTSTTNIHADVNVATTADGSGVNNKSNEATNLSPPKSPPSYPHTDTAPVYATATTTTTILSSATDNNTPSLKPHPEPMMTVNDIATSVATEKSAMAATPRRTPLSSGGSGSGNVSGGGGCWTDDEAYENLPKTPLAPPQTSLSTSSSSRSLLRQSTMSPIPGSAGSSVGSGGFYLPDIPPAPPTTPAAGSMLLTTIAMGSCATPLPYTGGFVQNAYQLEQQLQHRQLQQRLNQNQQHQQHDQFLQNAGAATPAPPKPQTQAPTPKTRTATTSLSDDFSEWAVGDRYKLSRMLGRGSYGEVAQAVDLYQGRADAFVAIKRIVGPFEQEVDAVRLFREIHILRLLKVLGTNDCIVPLLDVVQPPTDDLNDFHDLYLVFDYVDTDLYKLIMSPQYLTTEHIQTFLYQMLIGLKYIHSCNVIHRDLKPANILLNEDCSLKICDFGLARIVDEVSVAISTSSASAVSTTVAMKRSGGRSCSIAEQVLSHDDNDGNHMPAKTPLTRQLTKHVVTRWYRAPELILIQPYTTAVDIWSMGCIFAELLSMQEGSVPGYQDRTPLFPGGACYPLSGDTDNEERLDQLNVIFGVIGTPSEEDIAEVGNANEYIKTLKPMKPKSLKDIYPAADPNALDLLHNMLKFNPKQRYTAGEALEHKFFSGIRREEMETSANQPMKSPEFLNDQNIGIELLKQKTYEEVLWFRDNSIRPNPPQEQPSTE